MSKNKAEYIIHFKGLAKGRHKFNFVIDDVFFRNYENQEIKTGNLNVNINLEKDTDVMLLDIYLEGNVNVCCDRCLEYFDLPVSYKTKLTVNFGDENSDLSDADEKIIIAKNVNELTLDKHFYDYINLNIPYRKIHQPDSTGNSTCNVEMLDKIEEYSSNNKNKIDPRWNKLKELLK